MYFIRCIIDEIYVISIVIGDACAIPTIPIIFLGQLFRIFQTIFEVSEGRWREVCIERITTQDSWKEECSLKCGIIDFLYCSLLFSFRFQQCLAPFLVHDTTVDICRYENKLDEHDRSYIHLINCMQLSMLPQIRLTIYKWLDRLVVRSRYTWSLVQKRIIGVLWWCEWWLLLNRIHINKY